jgi:multiple sugar transport system substrate-binding protein
MFKKEMNRRDFLKVSTIAAGAAALAACAPAAKPADQSTSGGAAPAAEQITLVQYYHEYGEKGCAEASKRYADEYTTVKANVKVDRQWIPGDYAQKLNAALLTDQAPDVFESGADASRYKAGLCADLTDLYSAVKDDFNPTVLEEASWQGKIMGIKMIVDTGMIYGRKSVMDAAGVKMPTTVGELIDASKALTTDKQKGLFLGNDGYGAVSDQIMYSTGLKSFVDVASKKVMIENDRVAEALTKLKKLNDDGSVLLGAPTDWWDPGSLTTGLCAMMWCGLWAMPGIREAIQEDFYVVPFPKYDDQGTPSTFLGGWTTFVAAKGKHVDEAKAFAKWLWIDNVKDQQDWSLSYGFHIPPRKSAASTADKLKSGPAKDAWDAVDKYGHTEGPYWTGAMGTLLDTAKANIIKNGADPKTELATAAKGAQAELDKVLAG